MWCACMACVCEYVCVCMNVCACFIVYISHMTVDKAVCQFWNCDSLLKERSPTQFRYSIPTCENCLYVASHSSELIFYSNSEVECVWEKLI